MAVARSGIINRSIGIDFRSTNPADYPIDPGVIDPNQLQSPDPQFFLHSLRSPDPTSNAVPGQPTSGLYASPSALPGAQLLISFGAAADAGAFNGDYDVYVMTPTTGVKTKLLGEPGFADVDGGGRLRAPRPPRLPLRGGRAERHHAHRGAEARRRRHGARHARAVVAALPEHADRSPRRSGAPHVHGVGRHAAAAPRSTRSRRAARTS